MGKLMVKLLVSGLVGVLFVFAGSPRFRPRTAFMWGAGATAVILIVASRLFRRNKDDEDDMSIPALAKEKRRAEDFPNSYTVIDIETTGLEPQTSEITELAAIKVRNGRTVDTFQKLVAINGTIPQTIVEKTHITQDMLSNAEPLKKVLRSFFAFIGDDILIGYNIRQFDVPFISFYSERLLGRSLQNKMIEVWDLAVRFVPGLPNYRLDTLRKAFNLDSDGAHRALKDCSDTNAVYQALPKSKKKSILTTSRSKVKSIYRMTDKDFQLRFGENWRIAAEIVSMKKEIIATGCGTDWEAVRESWSPSTPATEAQLAMLVGAGVPTGANLSKRDASLLIDDKMLELDVNREVEQRRAKAEKESAKAAMRAEREKQKAIKANERAAAKAAKAVAEKAARQAELEHYDGPRRFVSSKCMAQWRDEFTCIWNGILADDVIEVDELIMLKKWLNRHKRRRNDFYSMLKLIDDVVADGIVTKEEAQLLYATAVEVLDQLSTDADGTIIDPVEKSAE